MAKYHQSGIRCYCWRCNLIVLFAQYFQFTCRIGSIYLYYWFSRAWQDAREIFWVIYGLTAGDVQ